MVTRHYWWQALAAMGLSSSLVGCQELAVTNPNAPERERAFSDPATIVASAAGTIRTWVNTRWFAPGPSLDAGPPMTLSRMADSYTASWNNWNMRYYGSIGTECARRCGWVNSTATSLGEQVEPYWYGTYSLLSSANDALFAIRKSTSPPDLGADKAPVEAIAQMAQAIAHAFISLNYDKGFIIDESSDVTKLEFSARGALRDKAIELFEKGIQLAKASSFSTGGSWFGVTNSPVYTGAQLAKVMRTMEAEVLVAFPRNAEENAQVNWAKVVEYAREGISSNTGAAAFDFEAYQDEVSAGEVYNDTSSPSGFGSLSHVWGNDITTVRVHTRVSKLMSSTQADPWPGGTGSPRPVDANGNPVGGVYGVDLRLGDGCFGPKANYLGMGGCKGEGDPLAGTDFMWSPLSIFRLSRGTYHVSNIGHIRYHCLVVGNSDCPTGGTGADPLPLYTKAFNDLLWAEGLIRTNSDFGLAAQLINNTRVTRGGLPPVTAANTKDQLLQALQYEQDLELISIAATQYYNRRRVTKSDGSPETPTTRIWLAADTPRQMPVPAKDLQLLREELYTFGGADNPTGMAPPAGASGSRVRNVREIYSDWGKVRRGTFLSPRRRN